MVICDKDITQRLNESWWRP